jgi:hypothetical protein
MQAVPTCRAPLDFGAGPEYSGFNGLGRMQPPAANLSDKQGRPPERYRPEMEDDMGIMLHAGILALGCATFVGIILCSGCPDCGWQEWVSERFGADRTDQGA